MRKKYYDLVANRIGPSRTSKDIMFIKNTLDLYLFLVEYLILIIDINSLIISLLIC